MWKNEAWDRSDNYRNNRIKIPWVEERHVPFTEWAHKDSTGLILQKATHLDIIRGNVWPLMLMKKIFLLLRTKNSFLTKGRLSDYTTKRIRLWSRNLYRCQYNTQMLRKKHNGVQHSRIQKTCHPCTDIISEENIKKMLQPHENSISSKSLLSKKRKEQYNKHCIAIFKIHLMIIHKNQNRNYDKVL